MRFLAASFILLACLLPATLLAGPGPKKKAPAPYALISGTVFRDSGLALPRAEVTVAPQGAFGKSAKHKKTSAVADSRGEFAIRVPALPMRYTVIVKAPGYQTQEKSVSIAGEDRVDVFFRLEAASK